MDSLAQALDDQRAVTRELLFDTIHLNWKSPSSKSSISSRRSGGCESSRVINSGTIPEEGCNEPSSGESK